MKKSFIYKLSLVFVITLVVIMGSGWLAYINNDRAKKISAWIVHTETVLDITNQTFSLIQDVETRSRGFALTGDVDFLGDQDGTKAKIYSNLDTLRYLTADNPLQNVRIDSLGLYVRKRMEFDQMVADTRRSSGIATAADLISQRTGKLYMDRIRQLIVQLQAEEKRLLEERRSANIATTQRVNLILLLLFAATIVIVVLSFIAIRNYLRDQKRHQLELEEWTAGLEEKIKMRTEDITRNERRFRNIIENGNDVIILQDSAGMIVYQSPSAERIIGWSGEMPGHRLEVHPQDHVLLSEKEQEAKQHPGTPIRLTLRLRHQQGYYIWIEGILNALFHDESVHGMLLNFRDITERVKSEQKLRETLKEVSDYKYALDTACIIAITDQKGVIRQVNENFCRISQYTPEELIGQDHRIVNSQYHPPEFIKNLWVTIANGKTWSGEIRNKAKDGTYYWVATTIIPFLDERGKPYQYMAIREDITDRKKAEEQIRQMTGELEERVKMRTQQLQEANQELESFTYSVSHDLRAPLRSIDGFTRILSEDYTDKLDDEAKRLMDIVLKNAKKMANLIDDLLAFSRLGKKEISRRNFSMNEMVQQVYEDILPSTEGRDIKWTIADLPDVPADTAALRQVWVNIISNAVKYTRHTEKTEITIGADEEADKVVYYVKDNGTGFDMQYIEKLFGVFQRLHSEQEFEGTGVGLAMVRRIINKHGGEVWAKGELNKGATLYFSLPKT
ncbi:sensor histidine kinase [Sediminibacterium ginsengisoli]|uniref:histidine kinase n=1 Tax=Sediminibacterium ginsengisoli TaxID=413434 RepID=A0A1T4JS35_9BACT|nr:PAS domain S-box protein [Sediminibacterium ginsengisoli]SJZ32925.1 PAS domain S-box-containing protein [Sediminibacterium ginsengisoli]